MEADRKKIAAIQLKLTALQKLQAARFLQGNLLDALQHATVEGVQLTRLRVDQSYFLTEGTEPQTNGDRVIAGRPANVKERIIAHLDARDSSANPGDQVNKFKEVIAKQAYFRGHAGPKPTGCNSPIHPPRRRPMPASRMSCSRWTAVIRR